MFCACAMGVQLEATHLRARADTPYSEVMSQAIRRHAGHPAGPTTDVSRSHKVHTTYECSMPKCRRRGCQSYHPDCCNAQMARMLADVAKFLRSGGYNFAPTFGTLLGALRNQAIIPWTEDVDISVDEEGINALLSQEEIPYRFFRPPNDPRVVRGCPYSENGDRRYFL